MLDLTHSSGRCLREGDAVRLPCGTTARVVGIDVLSEAPLVVQVPGSARVHRLAPDAVDVYPHGASYLSPFPTSVAALVEGLDLTRAMGCGSMVSIPHRDGGVVTVVPTSNVALPRVLKEALSEKDGAEAMSALLQRAFVTRLPHLVRWAGSDLVEGEDPVEVVDRLLG